jgi:deoxyribodipyrimidine photolyase
MRFKEGKEMKYIVIDERKTGIIFMEEFDDKDEAINSAKYNWNRRTEHDKKRTERFYVLESVNTDEDADDHFDGDIIRTFK